jgi:CheY-like chemotaxis protein
MLQSAVEAAEKGAELNRQLLAFARRQKLDPEPMDLNAAVSGMRDLLQISVGGLIRLDIELAEGLWPAMADPTQLALAILNLAINARDAMPEGGTLTVATCNLPPTDPAFPAFLVPGDYVVVSVADTGIGMTDAVKARAFEPFFTTKPVGKGSGLGLSQVYGFTKQSNGGVLIDSTPGHGATVRLLLPRAGSGAQEGGLPGRRHRRPAGDGTQARHRILVVDDDAAVLQVTAAMLRRYGYEVVTAGSGGGALDVLARPETASEEEPGDAIDLMVIDFAMPGMNGVEAAREARTTRPDLPVLFVTGYADVSALAGIDPDTILGKPYRDYELIDRVAAMLDRQQACQAG